LPGGGAAIVKFTGRRRRKCSARRCTAPAEFQCDWPVAGGGTCDRYLCRAHSTPQRGRPNTDFCPEHAQAAAERLQRQIELALDTYPDR
jgi:hypothetical protein